MSAQTRVGIVTSGLTFVAGLWVFLAPFIVGYQDDWQDLANSTTNSLWTGGALIAISALTLLLFAAFALREAIRFAEQRTDEPVSQED